MEQRTALITGASDGIGAQAARQLRQDGWQVAVIGRSPDKTLRVARELDAPHYLADFSRLDEVVRLASELRRDFPRIDLLANNAGGMFKRQPPTADGFETTFQVNHLAPFLLTRLLMDRLAESRAKVIATSSVAHRLIGFGFRLKDVPRPRFYSQHQAYGHAKLCNILFTRELHRRCHAQGISAAAFHPGVVATSFAKESRSPMKLIYQTRFLREAMKLRTPAQGADSLLWLAEGEPGRDWQSGQYYADRAPGQLSRQAQDEDLARGLWELSEQLLAPWIHQGEQE